MDMIVSDKETSDSKEQQLNTPRLLAEPHVRAFISEQYMLYTELQKLRDELVKLELKML